MKERAAGFSLVEVMVAMALLAGVMVSIAGLFAFGGQQVNAGRNGTRALSTGRALLEDLGAKNFYRIYGQFGHDGTTSSMTVSSDPDAGDYHTALDPWQDQIEDLTDGRLEVAIESLSTLALPPPLNETTVLRLTVTVHWHEGLRQRQVNLMTVRM